MAQEVSPAGVVSYLWGPRGPEARIDPSGNALWFLYDGHGNVIAEAGEPDENGNPVKGMRSYGPWGGSTQTGTLESSLAYCGALGHPTEDTGLIYMRARYYDPLLGRFISEDPAKDGGNWYAYAGNDPVGMVDPDGREATIVELGGTMSLGAAIQQILARLDPTAVLREVKAINDVASSPAVRELIRKGQDPNNWKWVGASVDTGKGSAFLRAIVRYYDQMSSAYLEMELATHHTPYIAP